MLGKQVVSDKMQKSILVAVESWKMFPKYGKRIRHTKKYMVSCMQKSPCLASACMLIVLVHPENIHGCRYCERIMSLHVLSFGGLRCI